MADKSDSCDTVRSSIIMKIDSPDDNSNSNDTENEITSTEPSKSWVCTSGNVKTKMSNPFSSSSMQSSISNNGGSVFKPSFLRPAQLLSSKGNNSEANVQSSGPLAPSRLNPFNLKLKDEDLPVEPVSKENKPVVENNVDQENVNKKEDADPLLKSGEETAEPVSNNKNISPVNSPDKPLASTSSLGTEVVPPTNVSVVTNFVFGENVHARVVTELDENDKEKESNDTCEEGASGFGSAPSSNGTSENLFTSLLKKDSNHDAISNSSVSLSESAKAYEESRAVKRKYEEVEVITGEEGETNVLQFSCKLFAFHTSIWQERGRGTLRLNDKDGGESRLVWRNVGSHRVMLNTHIWAGMTVERASQKSLRITAMDSSAQVKVFLVMASPKEIDQLEKSLSSRVVTQKRNKEDGDEPNPKRHAQ